MPNLSQRRLEPELMDDPLLKGDEHARALRGLARVHALTGTAGRLWRPIERLIRQGDLRELTLMDVGCGDGKLLQQLGRRARKVNCQLRLVGCDFSSRALAMCQRAADTNGVSIELYEVDVMRDPLPVTADIIINSLFLHHFSDNQVVELLGKIRHSARRLIVIEDLVRSQIGYILCWIGVHVLTRSPVVHTDGPLSVKAAFTHSELRQLLAMAELENASCSRHWPERLLIHWTPDSRSGHER